MESAGKIWLAESVFPRSTYTVNVLTDMSVDNDSLMKRLSSLVRNVDDVCMHRLHRQGSVQKKHEERQGVEKLLELRHLSGAYFADLLYHPVLPTEQLNDGHTLMRGFVSMRVYVDVNRGIHT